MVLNTLLGGGMSSRLFQQIREKEGLAYAVYTFADFYVDTGIFGAYVGTDSSRVHRALEMIIRAFQECVSNPVADDELTRIKSQLKGNLMLGLESTSNRMIRLAKMEIYLDSHSSLDKTIADIDRVKVEDVQSVAADLFDSQKLVVTLLGPVEEDIITPDDIHLPVTPSQRKDPP